jgi:hypothetical protein
MSEDYSYFKNLTHRQQLNDLMHKYAQENGGGYGEGWKELDRRWRQKTGSTLTLQRWKHEQKHNIRITIPKYLEQTGKIKDAINIGHEMTKGKLKLHPSGSSPPRG